MMNRDIDFWHELCVNALCTPILNQWILLFVCPAPPHRFLSIACIVLNQYPVPANFHASQKRVQIWASPRECDQRIQPNPLDLVSDLARLLVHCGHVGAHPDCTIPTSNVVCTKHLTHI